MREPDGRHPLASAPRPSRGRPAVRPLFGSGAFAGRARFAVEARPEESEASGRQVEAVRQQPGRKDPAGAFPPAGRGSPARRQPRWTWRSSSPRSRRRVRRVHPRAALVRLRPSLADGRGAAVSKAWTRRGGRVTRRPVDADGAAGRPRRSPRLTRGSRRPGRVLRGQPPTRPERPTDLAKRRRLSPNMAHSTAQTSSAGSASRIS